ncbi:Nramp family divalent metal transporter [Candidatus Berkelbacteria bacterium]|nr:Nramp family divalent metal transporter [Candidatus Berkelbacteria bacterium]
MLGPGWTTGAADDDPSGIATYSQAGAQYGNQLLWLASFTFPLMAVVQEMCARIGLVTGRGLAANIRAHYPRWVLYLCTALLAIANTLNIGADLGAMAKATQLVVPAAGFTLVILSFALLSLMLQIFISYQRYARYLKYLALILLSYVLTAFAIENFDWRQALTHAVAPSLTFSREQIILVAGILGTTISPYLFFWQTSQEVEEEILHGKTTVAARRHEIHDHEIKTMRIDIWSGMFLSNVVMFFIIAVGAATLFASGTTTIATAADAAAALRPLAGENAYLLFALGIIGTGLLAIPVLAGSVSYALSESLGWQYGLYRKLKQAYAFYGVMILAILIGLAINFLGIDPIKALIWSAVGNGLIAPVILVLIVQLSNNKKVMGNWTNGPITNALGWLITLLMVLSGAAALIVLVSSVSSALF